jgi:hypothetical protein
MSEDIFTRDLNEQMEKAEFIIQRINSLRTQIVEEPTCNLQEKLDAYVEELKTIQLKMNTIARFISLRDGISKAITLSLEYKQL